MKAYLEQMPMTGWVLVSIPVLLVGHAVFVSVAGEVVRRVVPETVLNVLRIMF